MTVGDWIVTTAIALLFFRSYILYDGSDSTRNTRGRSASEGDETDRAGTTTAREFYSETCKKTGWVRAGSPAAAMMSAAMTPDVRRAAQRDGGCTPKGGETARKASEETARRRQRPCIHPPR